VNRSATTTHLVYMEHQPGLLRCVALGGSPPPDIELKVGQQDITSTLTMSRSPTLSRERGLRLVYYTTEMSTDRLQLTADDDGALLQCVVTVPGLPSNVTTAHIIVHCMTDRLNVLLLSVFLHSVSCGHSYQPYSCFITYGLAKKTKTLLNCKGNEQVAQLSPRDGATR